MHHISKLCSYNIFVLKGKDEILVCQESGRKGLNFKMYFKGKKCTTHTFITIRLVLLIAILSPAWLKNCLSQP